MHFLFPCKNNWHVDTKDTYPHFFASRCVFGQSAAASASFVLLWPWETTLMPHRHNRQHLATAGVECNLICLKDDGSQHGEYWTITMFGRSLLRPLFSSPCCLAREIQVLCMRCFLLTQFTHSDSCAQLHLFEECMAFHELVVNRGMVVMLCFAELSVQCQQQYSYIWS